MVRDTTYNLMLNCGLLSNASWRAARISLSMSLLLHLSLSLMDLSGLVDDDCCEDDLLFGGPVLMGDL
eukprot:gene2199-2865_t